MTKTVLILGGSGKVGWHTRDVFARAGWHVRLYDRKTNDMVSAARGVQVIVNCLNPPGYHDWEHIVPETTRAVIEAARDSGATVILPGNVYNLGAVGGEWSEDTPHVPNTRKGKIREEMERAYAASGVQTLVLRAGNFIDSRPTDDVMQLLFLRRIRQGKLTIAGDPEALQPYCYLPDWARAAVMLAEKRAELGRFEDIPFGGLEFTAEELRMVLAKRLGRPVSFTQLPWWLLSLASPFWEVAYETLEMRYLWSLSHRLSTSKLRRLLPDFEHTPRETAMTAGLRATDVASPEAASSRAA